MYLTRIRAAQDQPRLGQPSGKPVQAAVRQRRNTDRGEGQRKTITILAGPSPYQAYIERTSRPTRAPRRRGISFGSSPTCARRCQAAAAPVHGARRQAGRRNDRPLDAHDLHDRDAGAAKRDASRVRAARGRSPVRGSGRPAPGSCPRVCVGTFQRTYGTGFGEGGTQAITEAIMGEQGIARYYRDAAVREFTQPMRKLIESFRPTCSPAPISWARRQHSRRNDGTLGQGAGCRSQATRR